MGLYNELIAAYMSGTSDQPTTKNWFYIEDLSGSQQTVKIKKLQSSTTSISPEYSYDGDTWTSFGPTTVSGVSATIPANGKMYVRCITNTWAEDDTNSHSITSSGEYRVGGNTMSLLYGGNFSGNEVQFPNGTQTNFIFKHLFRNCTNLVSAANIILPATSLPESAYESMFSGCTSLEDAPSLPATALGVECYQAMFINCTALTTAPQLPATDLSSFCYRNMFNGCTSLTSSPDLNATVPVNGAYNYMFDGCSNLSHIKCMLLSYNMDNTYNWVRGVSARGTFVKDSTMSSWVTGDNGIPSGWTVENA